MHPLIGAAGRLASSGASMTRALQSVANSHSSLGCRYITTIRTDNAIIGSGPAGVTFAHEVRRLGKSAIIIDTTKDLGGASLTTGTLPSKALWARAKMQQQNHNREKDTDLCEGVNRMIESEQTRLKNEFAKQGIRHVSGLARFNHPGEISVCDERDQKELVRVQAKRFFIATGSIPRVPANVPFDGVRVLNSTQLLSLKEQPKSMTVVGAGVIGTEYANIFAAKGTKVSLVDRNTRILSFIDAEISNHLLKIWASNPHFTYHPNVEVASIEKMETEVRITLKNGVSIVSDVMLYAQGRVANVKHLQVENAGIELSERGYIRVNSLFQTNISTIYSGGDVIGPPSLASTSWRQGHIAARYAWGETTSHFPKNYPTGIFTLPEIAYCGETEEQLKASGKDYKVGVADYSTLGRSVIASGSKGLVKILFEPDSGQIYGIHVIGEGACDIIHYGKVAMDLRAPISYFYKEISNYPTHSGEGFRQAALNGKQSIK